MAANVTARDDEIERERGVCACLRGTTKPLQRASGVVRRRRFCKLTWLVLGGDPAARSHRVEQFTAL